ncbi:MAG: tetratricopeptide repeat protein [Ignavibacteria bacterium]
MLKKTIIISILSFLFLRCSSGEAQRIVQPNGDSPGNEKIIKEAMEYFVQGSVAEAKGEYASAILEYQDALRLDPRAGIYYSLGKNYLQLNKLSHALSNSKNAVMLDSSNTDYLYLLAGIYLNVHQSDSAAIFYEKIIRLDSASANAYYNLASILIEQSGFLEALNVYKKFYENIGPVPDILWRIAEIEENLGHIDEAISFAEKLSSLEPSNPAIEKLLIDIYTKAKKYDIALIKLNNAMAIYPDDLSLTEMKGKLYLQQDNWEEADRQFTLLLGHPKITSDIKIKIGVIYINQSRKDSALLSVAKNLFQEMDKDSADWKVKMALGEIALMEKDDPVAIKNFEIVTELARWNADAWARLGGLYFDKKKYQEASSVLLEASQLFSDNFSIALLLGLSFSQLNQFRQAMPYLNKAVELEPKDITALSAYSYVLSQEKQPDEAVNYLRRALSIEPKNADLLGTLGLIYNAQKKWTECDSAYTEALKNDVNNSLLLNNYAYSLAERGVKLDEAYKMIETAVSKAPDNSSYLDTFGWVCYKTGDYVKAEEFVRKAIARDENNPTLIEHLGDILYKKGDKTAAVEMWQKAFLLNADNPELKTKIEKGEL